MMYGIFTYYHNNQPIVGKYAIFHGRYGYLRYLFTIYFTNMLVMSTSHTSQGFPRHLEHHQAKVHQDSGEQKPGGKPTGALLKNPRLLGYLGFSNCFWQNPWKMINLGSYGAVSRRPVGPGLTFINQYVSWENCKLFAERHCQHII